MNAAHILPSSPIAKALAVVGDRWSALVMREMFLGTTRFGELAAATGASRATLSKRLRAIAAQLHDQLGATLSMGKVKLGSLRQEAQGTPFAGGIEAGIY